MAIFLKFVVITLFFASLSLQAYILFIVVYEVVTMGRLGFASGMGYGAVLIFSVPIFFIATLLNHTAKTKIPTNWVNWLYFCSHIFIMAFMFAWS